MHFPLKYGVIGRSAYFKWGYGNQKLPVWRHTSHIEGGCRNTWACIVEDIRIDQTLNQENETRPRKKGKTDESSVRQHCRVICGADAVIGHVLPYLLDNNYDSEDSDAGISIDLQHLWWSINDECKDRVGEYNTFKDFDEHLSRHIEVIFIIALYHLDTGYSTSCFCKSLVWSSIPWIFHFIFSLDFASFSSLRQGNNKHIRISKRLKGGIDSRFWPPLSSNNRRKRRKISTVTDVRCFLALTEGLLSVFFNQSHPPSQRSGWRFLGRTFESGREKIVVFQA